MHDFKPSATLFSAGMLYYQSAGYNTNIVILFAAHKSWRFIYKQYWPICPQATIAFGSNFLLKNVIIYLLPRYIIHSYEFVALCDIVNL